LYLVNIERVLWPVSFMITVLSTPAFRALVVHVCRRSCIRKSPIPVSRSTLPSAVLMLWLLQEGVSPGTIRTYRYVLKAFLEYLLEWITT
jgi:hypothetical protein